MLRLGLVSWPYHRHAFSIVADTPVWNALSYSGRPYDLITLCISENTLRPEFEIIIDPSILFYCGQSHGEISLQNLGC